MLFKSALTTQASGSAGGLTASHNRGGQYLRARTIPTNPNTSYQQLMKAIMSYLVNRWNNTLTASQRQSWDVYAENVPLPNSVGDPINVGGVGMYVRSNSIRLQSAEPVVDLAPGMFNLGDYSSVIMALAEESSQMASVTFDNADDWANEDDAALLVYISRPQNPGINFYKGPYRYAGKVQGDSTTPPTSPASIAVTFPIVAGQKLFARVNVTRADGRLGTPTRSGVIVIA